MHHVPLPFANHCIYLCSDMNVRLEIRKSKTTTIKFQILFKHKETVCSKEVMVTSLMTCTCESSSYNITCFQLIDSETVHICDGQQQLYIYKLRGEVRQ